MFSMVTLTLFNIVVVMSPPQFIVVVLELMPLPTDGRRTLLILAAINVAVSLAFEQWGSGLVAYIVGRLVQRRRRVRDKAVYKAVDVR
jgi:cation-transporting P-type ATPase 13A2